MYCSLFTDNAAMTLSVTAWQGINMQVMAMPQYHNLRTDLIVDTISCQFFPYGVQTYLGKTAGLELILLILLCACRLVLLVSAGPPLSRFMLGPPHNRNTTWREHCVDAIESQDRFLSNGCCTAHVYCCSATCHLRSDPSQCVIGRCEAQKL